MATHHAADAVQAASAVVAGNAALMIIGPEALLWVLAALGMCSLGDTLAAPVNGRWRLASRYSASVCVTLAASYSAAAILAMHWPEYQSVIWPVRIGSALASGVLLHPLVAMVPGILRGAWEYVLRRAGAKLEGP